MTIGLMSASSAGSFFGELLPSDAQVGIADSR